MDLAEQPEPIEPDMQYTIATLKKMGYGRNWIERIRPCRFRNGLWLGRSILEYMHQVSMSNAAKTTERQKKAAERAKQINETERQSRRTMDLIKDLERARRNLNASKRK